MEYLRRYEQLRRRTPAQWTGHSIQRASSGCQLRVQKPLRSSKTVDQKCRRRDRRRVMSGRRYAPQVHFNHVARCRRGRQRRREWICRSWTRWQLDGGSDDIAITDADIQMMDVRIDLKKSITLPFRWFKLDTLQSSATPRSWSRSGPGPSCLQYGQYKV